MEVTGDTPTAKQEAPERWWTEFLAHWNKKYPTLPLYDTESAKFYTRRAVKFILTGSVDGDAPTQWPDHARVRADSDGGEADTAERLWSALHPENPKQSEGGAAVAAREIAERWFSDDLPEDARVHSTRQLQLQALAENVIASHIVEPREKCTWTYDPDGYWQTSCGDQFCISDGTPQENRMHYCHHCGLRLSVERT